MECDCDYILPTIDGWEEHYQNCSTRWLKDHGTEPLKNSDGTFRLRNKHLTRLTRDVLYHLGFDNEHYDLPAMFGDVKHGMGIPSMTILLQEVIKLLSYAKARDPIIIRIGTSGGLNIPPGSVVISSWGLNGTLKKSYDIPVMGKIMEIPSIFDKRLNQELLHLASEEKGFSTFIGGTMAADDFYQGQARLDGPFCDYTESDKVSFLKALVELGVKNIEMEATAFAAFTREAGLRSADVCVTVINRLEQDQVTPSKSVLLEWQERPMVIIGKYISKYYERINK
ncbi:uridine and thymidine phosphorylase-like isoform X2 [Pararge aegeria]|uniref:uridine and thymidine phosphorylase-like isoform X2 n=1 Tax=Pararge aegeria TaxID=116150 RepID=UPI0019D0B2F7|nr:uridine and thymidine phosphorylase-like isoform X2 [Pararge aegeria]